MYIQRTSNRASKPLRAEYLLQEISIAQPLMVLECAAQDRRQERRCRAARGVWDLLVCQACSTHRQEPIDGCCAEDPCKHGSGVCGRGQVQGGVGPQGCQAQDRQGWTTRPDSTEADRHRLKPLAVYSWMLAEGRDWWFVANQRLPDDLPAHLSADLHSCSLGRYGVHPEGGIIQYTDDPLWLA